MMRIQRYMVKGVFMNHFVMISLLSSLTALSGCHEKPIHNATTQSTSVQVASQHTAAPGKPRAPVRIEYQLSKDIQLGIPVIIHLSITPLVDAQQINLHYRTEGDLTSGDPQSQFSFGPTPARTTVQQDITVIAQAEGRFRVILSVTIASHSGHAGSRSMSIPIVVGNPPPTTLKPQGTMSTDPQGNPVIVTPAQEEIIKH